MRLLGTHRTLSFLVAFATLLAIACTAARDTPEKALLALQSALRQGDAATVLELHDAESRAYFRQQVREMRASGEGDPAYLTGSLDDAAARAMMELGQMPSMRPWLESCTVLGRQLRAESDGRSAATLDVRGADGVERDVHFLLEPEGWVFDAFRHYQESLGGR